MISLGRFSLYQLFLYFRSRSKHSVADFPVRSWLKQIWEFKDPETGQDRLPLNVNFGFGANVVMDRGEAEPKLRIRAQNFAFHFFPDPYLELRGKWPLGDTNLALCARYRSWSS